jgi:hypothetical protein
VSTAEGRAQLTVSWSDGQSTKTGTVMMSSVGIDLDEVLDALVAGLKATTDRDYTVESSEIAEMVTRQPIAPRGAVRPVVQVRQSKPRPDRPRTPAAVPERPSRST